MNFKLLFAMFFLMQISYNGICQSHSIKQNFSESYFYKQETPDIYDIPIRTSVKIKKYLSHLDASDESEYNRFIEKNPYADFKPNPFYYKADLNISESDTSKTFVISGVNCDETIRESRSLTGVSWETLFLRARGREDRGQFPWISATSPEHLPPEWHNISNVSFRASGDGFLERKPELLIPRARFEDNSPKFSFVSSNEQMPSNTSSMAKIALQDLLIRDNKLVRETGNTHQELASPLLDGIKHYTHHLKTEFEHQGQKYKITSQMMGGAVEQHFPASLSQPKENEIRRDSRKESGWTGFGVQGSPFNDELFSNRVYTFTKINSSGQLGDSFTIDGLTPHMIHRYGFYQGGDYRTDPKKIIDFFGVKPNSKLGPSPWDKCAQKASR